MLRRKCLVALQTAMLILCVMSFTAYGHPTPDLSIEGSVRITMRYGDQTVPGGTMTEYRVGDVRENNGDYDFVLSGEFAGSGLSLEDLSSKTLPAELAAYAETSGLEGDTRSIGEDGVVRFEKLSAGLYLFVQKTAASGYERVSPFLVSVPMLEDGAYVYDVEAGPKTSLTPAEPEPTDPTPVEPTDPAPTDPEPTDPAPTDPEPTRPSRPDRGDDDDDDDDDYDDSRPTRPASDGGSDGGSSDGGSSDPGTPTDSIRDAEPEPTDASVDETLPQTGQLNWPVPVLAATGLVVFAMGWGMFNRKRESDET